MKRCPECNRTYADETFSFCLADGALLSAPYDPGATLVIPAVVNSTQAMPLSIDEPVKLCTKIQNGNNILRNLKPLTHDIVIVHEFLCKASQ